MKNFLANKSRYNNSIKIGLYYYLNQDKFSESEKYLNRAISILENSFGKDHPKISEQLWTKNQIYIKFGRYDKAEEIFLKSLKIAEEFYGNDHVEVARNF